MTLLQQLQRGLDALQIELTQAQQAQLLSLLSLLKKWNRAYNLTAITAPSKMVAYHLLDSLAILPFIQGSQLLDVGTGAGFPGLPLAIANPAWQVTLLDSNSKKTRFLIQAIAELELTNAHVIHSRAENFFTETRFDAIISRAVGSVSQLIEWASHLCSCHGRYYLQKGEDLNAQLQELSQPFQIIPLSVPGITRKRHLIVVENNGINE